MKTFIVYIITGRVPGYIHDVSKEAALARARAIHGPRAIVFEVTLD